MKSIKKTKRVIGIVVVAAAVCSALLGFTLAAAADEAEDNNSVVAEQADLGNSEAEAEESVGADESGAAEDTSLASESEDTASVESVEATLEGEAEAALEGSGNACKIGETEYETVRAALMETKGSEGSPVEIDMIADHAESFSVASDQYITLDLNGHVLSASSNKRVITNYGTLTITDSAPTAVHYFKVASNGLWELQSGTPTADYTFSAAEGLKAEGVVSTDIPTAESIIAVSGGCITGGTNSDDGAGICSDGVIITLSSGIIVGNLMTATQYRGGAGIGVESGDINICGGAIVGNVANSYGGGVTTTANAIGSKMDISDGIIGYNVAPNGGGGGVIVEKSATATISGNTKIINNKAKQNGSAIQVKGSLTMTGGTVSNNCSCSGGTAGAVFIRTNGSALITGGEIVNNSSDSRVGAGISLESGAKGLTLGGGVKVTDNKGGSAESNLYLASGKTVSVDSTTPFTTAAFIGVTTADTPTEGNPVAVTGTNEANYSSYFTSDKESCSIANSGSDSNQVVQLVSHTHSWSYALSDDKATITATCGTGGCTATYTTLTITAPARTTYGDSEKTRKPLSALQA